VDSAYELHVYTNSTITHTVYFDSNSHDYNIIKHRYSHMNSFGETIWYSGASSYSVGLFSKLNFKTSSFLDSIVHEGEDYLLRGIANYDVTFEYVDAVESNRIVEYDESNDIIQKIILEDSASMQAFEPNVSTCHLRYFDVDSIHDTTVEAGNSFHSLPK